MKTPLLFLSLSMIAIAILLWNEWNFLNAPLSSQNSPHPSPPSKNLEPKNILASFKDSPSFNSTREPFALPPLLYNKSTKQISPLDLSSLAPDGISYQWKLDHRLPLNDDAAKSDPDNDGFNNLEEFRANTDPYDAQSHPPLICSMHIQQITPITHTLTLKNHSIHSDGSHSFQIDLDNTRTVLLTSSDRLDIHKRSKAKIGWELSQFNSQKIIKINPRTKLEESVDASELLLTHPTLSHQKILLKHNIPTTYIDYDINLIATRPLQKAFVHLKLGDTFVFLNDSYQIIATDGKVVVIQNNNDRTTLEIPLLTP